MIDLLRLYAEDDIDRNDDDPSSPPRLLLAKSSSPSVDYTALALSCATYNLTLSRPIDPTQLSTAFNPTYDQLWTRIYGPAQTELTVEQNKYAEEHSVVSLPRICEGDEGQPRRTMETEGGGSSPLIPNRQRQPTPLVGWGGFFWDLDGRKPEGKVVWRLWISFGEGRPVVFRTYYTVNEYEVQEGSGSGSGSGDGDGDGDEDQDSMDEICGIELECIHGVDVTCCLTKGKFHFLLFDLLKFIRTFPPPATIVFISGNAEFAPFLRKVKEKGYHVLVISESECASSAFQDVGLTLYDWIHGEGFFPLEEHGLPLSKKRDYASFSEEAH